MRARLLATLRRLKRDERGVSLVEFGIILPVLALMVGAIIDVSQGLAGRFALQNAVNRSLEMVQSRPPEADAGDSTVDYSFLTSEVATAAKVPTSKVVLDKWLECDGVKQSSFTGTCSSGAEVARYLKLTVTKDFTGTMFLKTTTMKATGALRIQ